MRCKGVVKEWFSRFERSQFFSRGRLKFHQNFDRQQDPEDAEEPFSEDSEPSVDFTE